MTTFADLNISAALLNALDEAGLKFPTPIQERAFSIIMSGQDVCGIAQTGTGKTLAYLLPCIRQLVYSKDRFPKMLVLVPTRELALQVAETAKMLCSYNSLVVTAVYGGVNMKPQAEALLNGTDIIIATPGRLYDLILTGALKTKMIKKFIIDEVDEMLEQGFRPQLNNIMDVLPAKRQNLMFSATLTEDVEHLINIYFDRPHRIEAAPAGTPLENIDQRIYALPNFNTKVNLLQLLLSGQEDMSGTMVFVASKRLADQVYEALSEHYTGRIGIIHGNKDQNHRLNTVQRFKNGEINILIATDIVARGIDIAGVSHVVNFDLPEVPEHYIHRIGRTGRADRKGIAISFVTEKEQEQLAEIELLMKYTVPQLELPEALVLSTLLTEDEIPKVIVKEVQIKRSTPTNTGAAFHEKKAKNTKVNHKISHKEKMMAKYGKKKTRGKKR